MKNDKASDFTPDQYNDVVRSSQIVSVNLIGNMFFVSPQYCYPEDEGDQIELTLEENEIFFSYGEDKRSFSGVIEWKARGVSNERKDVHFEIAAKYFVSYVVDGSHESKAVQAFFHRSAPLTAYPYFRALVSHLTWDAGAPIPPLPIKKTYPIRNQDDCDSLAAEANPTRQSGDLDPD